MSDQRILKMMAGLSSTPAERKQRRVQRQEAKALRASEQRVKLIEQIMQREQGTPGFRAMPFANLHKK